MKTIILATIVLTIITFSCIAQNNNTDFDYELEFIPTGQVENNYDTLYTVNCTIAEPTNFVVNKIVVKIKHSVTGSYLLNHSFNASDNANANLPSGLTLTKSGDKYIMGLGIFCPPYYDFEIRLEDSNHNVTGKGNMKYKNNH